MKSSKSKIILSLMLLVPFTQSMAYDGTEVVCVPQLGQPEGSGAETAIFDIESNSELPLSVLKNKKITDDGNAYYGRDYEVLELNIGFYGNSEDSSKVASYDKGYGDYHYISSSVSFPKMFYPFKEGLDVQFIGTSATKVKIKYNDGELIISNSDKHEFGFLKPEKYKFKIKTDPYLKNITSIKVKNTGLESESFPFTTSESFKCKYDTIMQISDNNKDIRTIYGEINRDINLGKSAEEMREDSWLDYKKQWEAVYKKVDASYFADSPLSKNGYLSIYDNQSKERASLIVNARKFKLKYGSKLKAMSHLIKLEKDESGKVIYRGKGDISDYAYGKRKNLYNVRNEIYDQDQYSLAADPYNGGYIGVEIYDSKGNFIADLDSILD